MEILEKLCDDLGALFGECNRAGEDDVSNNVMLFRSIATFAKHAIKRQSGCNITKTLLDLGIGDKDIRSIDYLIREPATAIYLAETARSTNDLHDLFHFLMDQSDARTEKGHGV